VALVDIIVQVHAVRLLIAEHQMGQIRATVAGSREPVLIVNAEGQVIFANDALAALRGADVVLGSPVDGLFALPRVVEQALAHLKASQHGWRRELDLLTVAGAALPMTVHAELVTGRDGRPLGFVLTLIDLRERRRADHARLNLESALRLAAQSGSSEADEVISAILTHASVAAMDIADARGGPPVAPLLQELETSTRRAAALYAQIRSFSS
jgi:PAS domain S-box-containing protein